MKKFMRILVLCLVVMAACVLPVACDSDQPEIPLVQYTVTFDYNYDGADQLPSKKVREGNTVTAYNVPSRDGYKFVGWFYNLQNSSPFDFHTPIENDITLYAKWVEAWTVTFNYNNDNAAVMQQVEKNTKATQPTTPTKTNYIFDGWYSDEGLQNSFDFNTGITESINLYAKWVEAKTVTFVLNNGSANVTQQVKVGGKATQPTNPTKEHYNFVAWYSNQDLSGAEFDFNTTINDNQTLYAKYEGVDCQVTFNTNEGTAVNQQTIKYGERITETITTTKTGYNFMGWFRDANFQTEFNLANDTITNNITLYAKWEQIKYTVKFNVFGGTPTPANQEIIYNQKVSKPETPTKPNYVFNGWYAGWNANSKTVTGTEFDFNTNLTETVVTATNKEMTLYANWVDIFAEGAALFAFETDNSGTCIKGYNATNYTGNTDAIILPVKNSKADDAANVTYIKKDALKNFPFKKVIIPEGIQLIGKSAFDGSTNIETVVLPNSLRTIGVWAFANCANLTSINIPVNVMMVGAGAFDSCTSLATVTFANNCALTEISYGMFTGCTSLATIALPNHIQYIRAYAFAGCSNLMNVNITSTLLGVADNAFIPAIRNQFPEAIVYPHENDASMNPNNSNSNN